MSKKPSTGASTPRTHKAKKPYITRLEEQNALLKDKLDEFEARLNFIPKAHSVQWLEEDEKWLHAMFKTESGKKFRLLLETLERYYTFHAVRCTDIVQKAECERRATGLSETLNQIHYWANHGRKVSGADELTGDRKLGGFEITPKEIDDRLSELARKPRFGASRLMSI